MKRCRKQLKKKGLGDEIKKEKKKCRSLTSAQLMMLREKERINQRKCRRNIGNLVEENINHPHSRSATSPYKLCSTLQKAVKQKKNSASEDILVQVDFAENYTIQQQNKVQSAHWSKAQIPIFTAYDRNSSNSGNVHAVISDDLDHWK
ncbi:hypothetical protein PR048_008999 [Dryococelus australis]|uniref:Uncharacterized protein n=1 Tax=Dryococelus australis TaxID=614101 RepID=A0ABQ9HYP2_9NEOP|nr:hypothetical protein PR048_008999 [Dryococelus australis]